MRNWMILWMLIFVSACNKEDAWDIVKTRGERVVEQLDFPDFHGIMVHNSIDVVLSRGDRYSATVEGWKNLMPKIRFSVEDGILIMEDTNSFDFVRNKDNRTTVYLCYAGELQNIQLSGNGDIVSRDIINASSLRLLCLDASGSVDLTIQTQKFSLGTNEKNVASVVVRGSSGSLGMTNWGYAPLNLLNLKVSHANIHHHGTGNVYVNVSESLTVILYSIGDLYYMGSPALEFTRKRKGNIFKM